MQYGYRGDSFTGNQERPSFFKDITIYGLWNQQYIAYTFINPIITNWSGDTYDYAQADGTMQHSMTIDYETVTHNSGEFDLEEDGPKGIDAVTGFGQEAYYDYTDSPNEDLGFNNNLGDFDKMFDPNNSDGENLKDVLDFANNVDPEKLINNAKNAIKDGLKDAALDALTGGLFGNGSGSGSPTMGSSPALIQISNQGGATAANNDDTTGGGNTAGKQNFGDSVISNISRNLGFG